MKLIKRLFVSALIVMAGMALTFTVPRATVTVEAGGSDCQVAGQVCRDISAGLYQLCINQTGNYADCALQEAQNTINCMSGVGCPLNN